MSNDPIAPPVSPPATKKWGVFSYYLNVHKGDCAIHILADSAKTKPEAWSAVWIDGGDRDDRVAANVEAWIAKISSFYTWPEERKFRNNRLQFDAILITHFDQDHWGSLHDIIYADFEKQVYDEKGQLGAIWKESKDSLALGLQHSHEAKTAGAPGDVAFERFIRQHYDIFSYGCERRLFVPCKYFKYDLAAMGALKDEFFDDHGKEKPLQARIRNDASSAAALILATKFPVLANKKGPSQIPANALLTTMYTSYQCSTGNFSHIVGPRNPSSTRIACPSFRTHNGRDAGLSTPYDYDNTGNVLSIMVPAPLPIAQYKFTETNNGAGMVVEKDLTLNGGKANEKFKAPNDRDRRSQQGEGPGPNRSVFDDFSGADPANWLDYNSAVTNENFTNGLGKSYFYFVPACKLVSSWHQYLGAELFSGHLLAGTPLANMSTPAALANTFVADQPRIGMFIIAGEQRILWGTTTLEDGTAVDYTRPTNATHRPGGSRATGTFSPSSTSSSSSSSSSSSTSSSSLSSSSGKMKPKATREDSLLRTVTTRNTAMLPVRSPPLAKQLPPVDDPAFIHDNSKVLQQSGTEVHKILKPVLKVVDVPLTGNDPSADPEERFGSIPKNTPSVACVIIESLQDDVTKAQAISYFAGDLMWDVETSLVPFFTNNTAGYAVMKASHHGDQKTSPSAFLRAFSPQHLYIPNDNGCMKTWKHPRWELLTWLHVFWQFKIRAAMKDNTKEIFGVEKRAQLWMSSYPWYLKDLGMAEQIILIHSFSVLDKLYPNRAEALNNVASNPLKLAELRAILKYLDEIDAMSRTAMIEDPLAVFKNNQYAGKNFLGIVKTEKDDELLRDAIRKEKSHIEDEEYDPDEEAEIGSKSSNSKRQKLQTEAKLAADSGDVERILFWRTLLRVRAMQDMLRERLPHISAQGSRSSSCIRFWIDPTTASTNVLFWDEDETSFTVEELWDADNVSQVTNSNSSITVPTVATTPGNSSAERILLSMQTSAAVAASSNSSSSSTSGNLTGTGRDGNNKRRALALTEQKEEKNSSKNALTRSELIHGAIKLSEEVDAQVGGPQVPAKPRMLRTLAPEAIKVLKSAATNKIGTHANALAPTDDNIFGSDAPAFVQQDDSRFRLYSQDFSGTVNIGDKEALIQSGGVYHDFIALTAQGFLTLGSKIDTSGVPVSLSDDHWAAVLTLAQSPLKIQDIRISGQMENGVAVIAGMDISLQRLGSQLKFSTSSLGQIAKSVTQLDVDQDDGLYYYCRVSLGITDMQSLQPAAAGSSQPLTVDLGQVLLDFGPPWLRKTGEILTLPGFDSGLKLQLDTAANSRTMLTVSPDSMYQAWLRLQFRAVDEVQFKKDFKTLFSFLGANVSVDDIMIVTRLSVKHMVEPDTINLSTDKDVKLKANLSLGSTTKVTVIVDFGADVTKFSLLFDETPGSQPTGAVPSDLISSGLTPTHMDPSSLAPSSDDFTIAVRRVTFRLQNPNSGSSFGLIDASATFEFTIFQSVWLATVQGPPPSLDVTLWTQVPIGYDDRVLASFEKTDTMQPLASQIPGKISLISLIPGVSSPPAGISLDIVSAEFQCTVNEDNSVSIYLRGGIECDSTADSDVPCFGVTTLDVDAWVTKPAGGATSTWDVFLSSTVILVPRDTSRFASVELDLSVEYVSGTDSHWTIEGYAVNLNFAALYDMFDEDSCESVMDLLDHFSIPSLAIKYMFSESFSSLNATGTLMLGDLALGISYHYEKAKSGAKKWSIEADLGFCETKMSLSKLLAAFDIGNESEMQNALDSVPFIGEITFDSQGPLDGSVLPAISPIQLMVYQGNLGLCMWFRIELNTPLGAISVLFVQFTPNPPPIPPGGTATTTIKGTNPSTNVTPKASPKRLLRVRIDKLPKLPDIPIVGNIDQPVDSVDYLYVSSGGFARTEIDDINLHLDAQSQVKFRDPAKTELANKTASNSNDALAPAAVAAGATIVVDVKPVLLAGHHIIVVSNGDIVVDHIFGGGAQNENTTTNNGQAAGSGDGSKGTGNSQGNQGSPAGAGDKSATSLTSKDSGATLGATKKSAGPLTISNFGIQIKDDHLWLLIDADAMLGTIKFSLISFGIGLPLTAGGKAITFNRLGDISPSDFKIKIDGMNVYFSAPPVTIAGFFRQQIMPDYENFQGGLTISVLPYSITALGEYRHQVQPDFKSVFVFGRFDGPLITLEFAEITGVAVAFGRNFNMRNPQPKELSIFPLLVPPGPAAVTNPMDLMTKFTTFLSPEDGAIFFSFGMMIDAFEVVSCMAALIVAFDPHGIQVSMVGMAAAAFPPVPPPPDGHPVGSVLYVELAVVASIGWHDDAGSIMEAAQLTPNSYIFHPDCHLTGGFAMCYWFGLSALAGDWVFTMGGYHPSYQKPDNYPDVGRVGISWNLSDCLAIRGEAYFAVTPKMAMGGGRLLATFSAGPIEADLEAWTNFIFNFNPVYFIGDAGVRVDVSFNVDFLFVHIHIHASLDADMHLQGPPFGGYADVHFYVCGFTVYFGDQNDVPDPIGFGDFIKLIQQPGPGSQKKQIGLITLSLSEGIVNEQIKKEQAKPGDEWVVRPGSFRFRVESKVPVTAMDYNDGLKHYGTFTPDGEMFYARQMHTQGEWISTLTVSIVPMTRSPDIDTAAKDDENPWNVAPIQKRLPASMFGQYRPGDDPMRGGNNIAGLLNASSTPTGTPATIELTAGYTFSCPKPRLPNFQIPAFNVNESMREGVFQDGSPQPPRANGLLKVLNLPEDEDERPHLPQSPPVQLTDLPATKPALTDDDGSAPWYAIENALSKADDTVSQTVAYLFSDIFAWQKTEDAPPATDSNSVGSVKKTAVKLVGTKPSDIVGKFEDYYMSCPFISVT